MAAIVYSGPLGICAQKTVDKALKMRMLKST